MIDGSIFRFWSQKVLPLVYDESLSYYEVLCKVVLSLQELCKVVDENIVNIDDKIEEEINKMIEEGTLTINEWDETPLSDTADGSAGESNKLSRGDHRHPLNSEVVNLLNRLPITSVENLNELSNGQTQIVSYNTSTLNIPTVGRNGFCIHYASSANYAVQFGMGVGDQTVYTRKKSGGTWSNWEELTADLTNIHQKLARWDGVTNGKVLFLGNSYGKNSYSFPKWTDVVAECLNLGVENTDWFNVCEPAHSLYGTDGTSGAFITDLQTWVANNPTKANKIGAVVLVAGLNDARAARASHVEQCLSDLADYIRSALPNAIMYNGYCGWVDEAEKNKYNAEHPAEPDTHGGAGYRHLVAMAYMRGRLYGWNYLTGIENVYHNKNDMADRLHPNEAGEELIGLNVANALVTGSCDNTKRTNSGVVPSAYDGESGRNNILDIYGNETTETESASTVNNGNFLQWIQSGIIRTQWASVEFTIAPALAFVVNHTYAVASVNLPFSNSLDFGNQMLMCRTDEDNQGITGIICRVYLQPRTDDSGLTDICFQVKGYADGSSSKNITRLVRFVADCFKPSIED